MNRRNLIALVFSLVLLLTAVVNAVAQFNGGGTTFDQTVSAPNDVLSKLTYQGRLTNSGGSPINSTVNVVFKLYDVNSVLIWTSATRSITPVNGLFTVYLGDSPDPLMDLSGLNLDSIGITVGSDPEMTPRQPLNSVYGHGVNGHGVIGSSVSGSGVFGISESGVAAIRGEGKTSDGVYGTTRDANHAGVVANSNWIPGIGLEIRNGAIKVTGASSNTSTPVFMHHVYTSTTISHNSTLCPGSNFASVTSNTYTNGNPYAILLVTPNYLQANPPTANGAGPAKDIPAVFYSVNGRCGAANDNRWVIYNLNATPMVDDTYYNVMVIVP